MASIPTVTVTGTVYEDDGVTLYNGPIYFRLPTILVHTDGTTILPSAASRTYTVADGAVAAELLYVDAPGWTPQDFTWEMRIPRGSLSRIYGIKPSVDDPDDVTLGDLIITDYVPNPGTPFAPAVHTHTIDQVTGLQAVLDSKFDSDELVAALSLALRAIDPRLVESGEFVLDRYAAQGVVKPVTGKLYLTVFEALETKEVLTVRTVTKAGAIGTGHSWIGFLEWDEEAGANGRWLPRSVSVDDPTRWSGSGLAYPTSVFAVNPGTGAADLGNPGFNEVAGGIYGYWTLWVDDTATVGRTGPELYAAQLSPLDAVVLPQIALQMDLAAPPSSFLERDWLGGSDRAYQGWMQP